MSTELERYCVLFDRLVHSTMAGISSMSESLRTWQPSDAADVHFGDRITSVTVKSLCIHLAVSEHLWFRALASCADGASLSIPYGPELSAQLFDGDYLSDAKAMHADNMDIARGFSKATLTKKVTFIERSWTVMGFSWAIYGHHSYHLGHIDMFWRQSGAPGYDYHSFDPPEMA